MCVVDKIEIKGVLEVLFRLFYFMFSGSLRNIRIFYNIHTNLTPFSNLHSVDRKYSAVS